MAGENCDVAIVGAGLAGAMAAAELRARGLSVIILEARDRIGGRGYFRNFDGVRSDGRREPDEELDYGGSWITPWQSTIRRLCARHGIALRPRHPVTARRWYRDGGLHHDGPASAADRAGHERAIARIAIDAMLLKKGHGEDDQGQPGNQLLGAAPVSLGVASSKVAARMPTTVSAMRPRRTSTAVAGPAGETASPVSEHRRIGRAVRRSGQVGKAQ